VTCTCPSSPGVVAKYLGRMRTALLNDSQIRPTEYSRWADAHRRFASREPDRKTMEWLRARIEGGGVPPILLGVHARYPDVYVADGHHRAVLYRELEIREFPFRWCYIKGSRADTRPQSDPFPFHMLDV